MYDVRGEYVEMGKVKSKMSLDKQYQKRWFEENATGWFANANKPWHVMAMLAHLPPISGKVLEVGAGRFTPFLAARCELVTGDLSYEMLRLAVDSGATLVQLDVEALPFADNTFDYVVAFGILHHVPSPDLAVAECVRVARQGVYFIAEMNPLYLPYSLKIIVARERVEWGLLRLPYWRYRRILDRLGLSYAITLTDFANHRLPETAYRFVQAMGQVLERTPLRHFASHINIHISAS